MARKPLRIAVIGNAGGGKSTLARKIAEKLAIRHVEIDRLLWRPGWVLAPPDDYETDHAEAMAGEAWVMDGLGRPESIEARLGRAHHIVLIDLPLWIHFWLAAERQIAWHKGSIDHHPAGADDPPPMEDLFRTIDGCDRNWMPSLREMIDRLERDGKSVQRIVSLDELNDLVESVDGAWQPPVARPASAR